MNLIMKENASHISKEPYKGVRDFYPEDMRVMRYITEVMRTSAEAFGYEEYTASVLESAELYEAKSGEEMVTNETYTFIDRGERRVTLRPEMTPTVARMIAAKRKELMFPLRWYSIPNLFRYERPQRGRLREHWQLNCDLFGAKSIAADAEILLLASTIMKKFGAKEEDFEIRINHRSLMNSLFDDVLSLETDARYKLAKLLDKKEKISKEEFLNELTVLIPEKATMLSHMLEAKTLDEFLQHSPLLSSSEGAQDVLSLLAHLSTLSLHNVRFVPTLMRGFDYYNGMVFEVFDTNPENRRSIFGGGRYDHLVDIFGVESVPAVGFGMGDVTIADFLTTHDLLPAFSSAHQLYIATVTEGDIAFAHTLATNLRASGINVLVNVTNKKLGEQVSYAAKKSIPFVLTVGENERAQHAYPLKNMLTKEECVVSIEDVASLLLNTTTN